MAIYCISDIHGYYDEFIALLETIDLQENDELYILGDIIDRGPQSAEMLWYATKEAPSNVHFLLGNHEDMMNVACEKDRLTVRMEDSWVYNGGLDTIEQIKNFEHYSQEWEEEILNWSRNLSYFFDIQVNGQKFILVHAGLQRYAYDRPDDATKYGSQYPLIEIDGCGVPQNRQGLIWNRVSWIMDRKDWPFNIVCGHTPVNSSLFRDCSTIGELPKEQRFSGGIVHLNKVKHFIDCGVHYRGMLAALRLDDMKEFYIREVM